MKFCTHCGKQLYDEAIICPGCGCAVQRKVPNNQVLHNSQETVRKRFCVYCGKELGEDAEICMGCGCRVNNAQIKKKTAKSNDSSIVQSKSIKVANGFMILSIVLSIIFSLICSAVVLILSYMTDFAKSIYLAISVFFVLNLAWKIPMYVHFKKSISNNIPVGAGFKVCTLLFFDVIAGILLFCYDENKNLKTDN